MAAPDRKAAKARRPAAHWKYLGLSIGAVAGALWLAALSFPVRSEWVARGPMTVGHELLACADCHLPAAGTLAQQFSANVYHLLGLRRNAPAFGSRDVASGFCLDCHQRPDDRHPISRFLEPHFIDARHALGVHECMGCHLEHQGKRVTLPTIGICVHCHEDTALQSDPIAPTHAELVRADEWNTCLRCHDFHGNHPRETPMRLADGIPEATVRAYFDGAPSPYAKTKTMKAGRRNMVEVPAEVVRSILRDADRAAGDDGAAASPAEAAPAP